MFAIARATSAYASASGYGRRLMGQLWANGPVSETMNKGPQKQKGQAADAYNDKMLLWSGLLGLKRLKNGRASPRSKNA